VEAEGVSANATKKKKKKRRKNQKKSKNFLKIIGWLLILVMGLGAFWYHIQN
jgi:hypothetical protein